MILVFRENNLKESHVQTQKLFLSLRENYNKNAELPWLRWWDTQGNLLLTGEERAVIERQKRERITEKLRTLSADQLNALGIDPEMLD